jgi:CHAD domain-containing protein
MKFRLRRQKPVRRTIGKLFAYHLARCRSLMTGGEEPEAGRVHESRKSVKRLRALISLVRRNLRDDARWFDRHLRDVNRTLSPIRDAHVLREAMDRLVAADANTPDEFALVRARLLAWTDQRERLSHEAGESVLRQLNAIEARWKRARIRGRGWPLLEDNIERAYRRARKAALQLSNSSSVQDFHELRKLVKVAQYHWEFLEPMWPERLKTELAALESLTDSLGHLHDAVLLEAWLADPQQGTAPLGTRQLMLRRLKRQQRELQLQARQLAPRCFAEMPRSVLKRLEQYWRLWRRDNDAPPLASTSPPQSTALSTDRL